MKSYSSLIREFSVWQRRELEALFIVLDWTKNYQKMHPNQLVGKEWMNSTELTIRIIYDDAFSAIKNRGIAFFSGSDTTEAPPEIIRSVVEELEKHTCPSYTRINSPNYCYSASSDFYNSGNDTVNVMYFAEKNLGSSSTQDMPFGFQFPNKMHINFEDRKQDITVSRDNSTSSFSMPSSPLLTEREQREMVLPFASKHYENTIQKQEILEVHESSHLDLTRYFNSSLESQTSNPSIEFFRVSSGFIPPPKNSDIANKQCTSPFCLCASVKAAYKQETIDENPEEYENISEVPIEPYLEVENIFPKLELPDSLNDTVDSFLLQPFNTPNCTKDLDTSSESIYIENVREIMPGTPRTPKNNPEDKDIMLQPFNTPVTPGNMSGSSNLDTSLGSSLGVADLGVDEDIAKILSRKCSMDYDEEYVQKERLRILSSYENSRLQREQKRVDENEAEPSENENFATSTPNWRYTKDKYRNREY